MLSSNGNEATEYEEANGNGDEDLSRASPTNPGQQASSDERKRKRKRNRKKKRKSKGRHSRNDRGRGEDGEDADKGCSSGSEEGIGFERLASIDGILTTEHSAVTPDLFRSYDLAENMIQAFGIVGDEADLHGREIYCSLSRVPGLWTASLGGSRVSLLVEVAGLRRSPRRSVTIMDRNGQTAILVLPKPAHMKHFKKLHHPFMSSEDVPNIMASLSYHDFLLIKGSYWEELKDGFTGIRIKTEEGVSVLKKEDMPLYTDIFTMALRRLLPPSQIFH